MSKKFALIAFGNEESYGLLFVGGELALHGQEYKFFDAEEDDVAGKVVKWAPDFICFSPMTTFYRRSLVLAEDIKAVLPETISVYGGHHAMSAPSIVDDDLVDVVVVGPVRGSVKRILDGEKGLISVTPTTPDDMPLPDRKTYYKDIPRMAKRYRKFMLSMHGCPWNCSYCSSSSTHMRHVFGKDSHKRFYLARRPMDDIKREVQDIMTTTTHEIEWVDDDIFFGPDLENWIEEFVSFWKEKVGVPIYVSTTSVNALKVKDKTLETLKNIVNCVGMGVQAIRHESLKLFNRAWDNEGKMKKAYDRLISFGYSVNLQCIVGLPVDDPVEDAIDTIKGLQRIGQGSIVSCYPLLVFPGTKIHKHCIENNIPLDIESPGDTNTGITSIAFSKVERKRLRNICKLATLFVKYGIEEEWMRVLIDVDFGSDVSQALSMARYHECVVDRLKGKGEQIFSDILKTMKLKY